MSTWVDSAAVTVSLLPLSRSHVIHEICAINITDVHFSLRTIPGFVVATYISRVRWRAATLNFCLAAREYAYIRFFSSPFPSLFSSFHRGESARLALAFIICIRIISSSLENPS